MSVSEGLEVAPDTLSRPPHRRAVLAGLDGSTRKEACRWLASAGFEVLLAEDEAGALEVCGRVRADVVLVDMALDHAGGSSLCRTLRSQSEGPQPVIALCWTRREASAALESGATELLERPFDWRVACLRAERLVRLAEAEADLTRVQKETEGLRKALDDERRERTWHDQCDAAHRAARRRAPGKGAGERSRDRLRHQPGGGGPVRDRASRPPQQSPGPRPRELRPPAGRSAPDRRPPLRRDTALLRGPVDVHGRPRRRRVVRGHAHGPARAARGQARHPPADGPSLGPVLRGRRGDRRLHLRRSSPRPRRRPDGGDDVPTGGARDLRGGGDGRRHPLLRTVVATG